MSPETQTTETNQLKPESAGTNNELTKCRVTISDLMATNPIWAEEWHQVAHVRKTMLMHSFSYIPVKIKNKWNVISDKDLATYLISKYYEGNDYRARLRQSINDAIENGLKTIENLTQIPPDEPIVSVEQIFSEGSAPGICLVIRKRPGEAKNSERTDQCEEADQCGELIGVLTPFDFI